MIRDVDNLTEMEIVIGGKGYVLRSEAKGTTGKVFQACGVALPPTLRQCGTPTHPPPPEPPEQERIPSHEAFLENVIQRMNNFHQGTVEDGLDRSLTVAVLCQRCSRPLITPTVHSTTPRLPAGLTVTERFTTAATKKVSRRPN